MIEIEQYESGFFRSGYGYEYFLPCPVNDHWSWKDPALSEWVENAALKIGALNSFADLVPDLEIFLLLYISKEAVSSSRIEGTATSVDETLLHEHQILLERRHDWREVQNYINAMNEAIRSLDQIPLSMRLLRQSHHTLLSGVRGEHKLPGEFRSSQNWIGGRSLADAVFIPPQHHHVAELMGDLEKFLHSSEITIPALLRIGIAHYQFETIHPFLDGNGRMGRLLISLYLVSEGILKKPLLYLSSYFESSKELYYNRLTRVRTHNELSEWLQYFLAGIQQTADDAISSMKKALDLKSAHEQLIIQILGKRTANGLHLLHELYRNPIITVERAAEICETGYSSANQLVRLFCENGILEETSGKKRNRIYRYDRYIDIFRSGI